MQLKHLSLGIAMAFTVGVQAQTPAPEIPPNAPNTIVMKVKVDNSGRELWADITPVRVTEPVKDEKTAQAAAVAATAYNNKRFEVCQKRIDKEIANLSRVARHPDIADVWKITADTVAGCDVACSVKVKYAIWHYHHVARNPNALDEEIVAKEACTDVKFNDDNWVYNAQAGKVRYQGRGAAGFGRGLSQYYPGMSTGTHPNLNIPLFTSSYNGYGNPFGPSGYTLFRPSNFPNFRYYFFYNPLWF